MNKNKAKHTWTDNELKDMMERGLVVAVDMSANNCLVVKNGYVETPEYSNGSAMFIGLPITKDGIKEFDPVGIICASDGIHVMGVTDKNQVTSLGNCTNAVLLGNIYNPLGIFIPLSTDNSIERFKSNVDNVNKAKDQYIDNGKDILTSKFDVIKERFNAVINYLNGGNKK